MKKLIAILCILILLPVYAFAVDSPTSDKLVSSKPWVSFVLAEKTEHNWLDILTRLEKIPDEIEDYVLLEAIFACINSRYEEVEWRLPIPITTEHEPFVLIIDSEAIVKQEVSITEDGNVITDFTDFEPGVYYILFYIKGA